MTSAHHKGKCNRDRQQTAGCSARFRRTRAPRVESLEDRTLLATLQFSGGLGEQSTLDAVPQTENPLPILGTPATKEFTHNDGTAVSNVTLTTAASSTGNPGVNLDILSQGSVAKNGIANVAVNAGLANASGAIGPSVSVPVTIVATDSDESTGDPVTVKLSFTFNVKTFASNNATANFTDAASYTYDGATAPLASHVYNLGGSGVTPVGAGPMDVETGTLQAKIGDTFTISFSENLAGQTVAPFLGAGINNVGWLVDTNLDVSIAPDITLDSVSTKDSREATVNYDINGPDITQPFYIQIYRSDQPTYQSTDPKNVAVGLPYEVTDLQPGQYTTAPAIDLSSPAPNEAASPVEPLAPDPSLPYVLAVVVNAQGKVPTDLTVNDSQAHFKIWVVADVTYGFQLPFTAPPTWPYSMTLLLTGAGYDSALAFTWSASTPLPGEAVMPATAFTSRSSNKLTRLVPNLGITMSSTCN